MSDLKFIKKEQSTCKVVLSILDQAQHKLGATIPLGRFITSQQGGQLHVLVNIDTSSSLAGFMLAKVMTELELEQVALDLTLQNEQLADIVFAIAKRTWKLNKYKSNPPSTLKQLEVICENPAEMTKAYARYAALIRGQNLCKELAESPANIMHPEAFAQHCQQLKTYGIDVEVLGRKELTELKMNALLAVSQGSSKEPQVVVMKYNGDAGNPDIHAFVGKGVCFDSGGLFIKDQVMMPKMKYDKGGAAAVVGGMLAIAAQKIKVNAVGVIGLVENMPDGNAMRPSDVITSMSGKTIEIVDTDCEGRLVLADCLYYTQQKFNPSLMLSFATLTGETVACLAHEYAGLFTRDDSLASQITGEPIWRLPLGEGFRELIKSNIADLKNRGVNHCGENASAAEFLYEFVGNTRFAHIDIAGVAWSDEDTLTQAAGATGYGVATIENCAKVFSA